METTNTTGWWTCSDCGVDAELDPGTVPTGCTSPCPDCGDAMTERSPWELAA